MSARDRVSIDGSAVQAVYVRLSPELKARFKASAFKTPFSENKIVTALIAQWVEAEEKKANALA